MSTATLVLLIVVVVAVAAALFMHMQREKSRKLRTKFGSEYDRVVADEKGNARKAEAVLDERQKRVSKFSLRALTPQERDRFANSWKATQESFVDDPRLAVAQADRLVNEALKARGYPMGEFEQQAADISVEHPQVVDNYRMAHDIAVKDGSGQATTEELRKAMQHYRNLFENLLGNEISDGKNERVEAHR